MPTTGYRINELPDAPAGTDLTAAYFEAERPTGTGTYQNVRLDGAGLVAYLQSQPDARFQPGAVTLGRGDFAALLGTGQSGSGALVPGRLYRVNDRHDPNTGDPLPDVVVPALSVDDVAGEDAYTIEEGQGGAYTLTPVAYDAVNDTVSARAGGSGGPAVEQDLSSSSTTAVPSVAAVVQAVGPAGWLLLNGANTALNPTAATWNGAQDAVWHLRNGVSRPLTLTSAWPECTARKLLVQMYYTASGINDITWVLPTGCVMHGVGGLSPQPNNANGFAEFTIFRYGADFFVFANHVL